MAFQIAFDLYESATQQFLGRVLQALRATAPIPLASNISSTSIEASSEEANTTASVDEKSERKLENLVIIWRIFLKN